MSRYCLFCDGTDGYHNVGCPTGKLVDMPCPECHGHAAHKKDCVVWKHKNRQR